MKKMKTKIILSLSALIVTLNLLCTTIFAQTGLIGLWHLDGNTNDYSGYGHNGSIVGTVTTTAGKFGQAYHFDGSSYIDCGNVDINSTGEFSVSAWLKTTDTYVTEVWRMVVSKLDYTAGGPLEMFLGDGRNYQGSTGTATNFLAWNGGIGRFYTFSPYDLSKNAKDGSWHHLAVTFKPGLQVVYFDGLPVGSTTSYESLPNTVSSLHIGGTYFGPYHKPLIGDLDEVSVYNRALSASEILILSQGVNINDQNIANITSFEESKSTIQMPGKFIFSAFPNPVNSTLNISLYGNLGSSTIKIFDIYGRLVITKPVTQKLMQVNVSKLIAGSYFIKIEDEKGKQLYKSKFIKQD